MSITHHMEGKTKHSGQSLTTLEDYLASRHNEAKQFFKLVKKDFQNDDMHDYRVAVKRIRSVDKFLKEFPDKPLDSKYIRKIKPSFNLMGQVRELKIKLEWVKSFKRKNPELEPQLKGLKKKLKKDKKQAMKVFVQEAPRPRTKNFKQYVFEIKSLFSKLSETEIEHGLFSFFQKQDDLIFEISQNNDVNKWHEARKYLKIMHYLSEWVNLSPYKKLLERYDFRKVKHLTDTLGNWHDAILMHEYITQHTKLSNLEREEMQKSLNKRIYKLEKAVDWGYKKL